MQTSERQGGSERQSGQITRAGRRRRGGRRGWRRPDLKTIVILLIVLLAALRLASYISSISWKHLSDKGFSHAAQFENCIKVKGIDVSVYQKKINWKKVKSSEADFVFIRAGYRKSDTGELCEDDNFRRNIKAARRAGVMAGAYFFSQAINEAEAKTEADYLVELMKKYDADMPLVIDFETIQDGRLQKAIRDGDLYAASMFHDIVLAFCREVEAAGYESAVYANYDMLTNNMQADLLDDDAVIWAAQYGGRCDVDAEYRFWQCSESASVGGINGYVDQDYWYIEPEKIYETRAKAKDDAVSIGDCSIEVAERAELSNHRAEPKVTVRYDGKKLKKGKHYMLGYVCNTKKGTGYAIVRGIKNYRDWTAVPFTID